ncbi:MAG TPA: hypothetical protein VIN03_23425 [Roseateles sp.]
MLLHVAIASANCKGGENCGKAQMITETPLILILLPVTYVLSLGLAVAVLLPIAYALDSIRKLTVLSLTGSMLAIGIAAPLVFPWASVVVGATTLAAISLVFGLVALDQTE